MAGVGAKGSARHGLDELPRSPQACRRSSDYHPGGVWRARCARTMSGRVNPPLAREAEPVDEREVVPRFSEASFEVVPSHERRLKPE